MPDPAPDRAALDRAALDRYVTRARPTFLYMTYAVILAALPMGLVAALNPRTAATMTAAIAAYLAAIPQPLYALFGTGYLGYTAARQWGKIAGSDH